MLAVGNQGTIIRSSDSGTSWKIVMTGSDYVLNSLDVSSNICWIVGKNNISNYGILFNSLDAGLNWSLMSIPQFPNFNDIFFVGPNTGFIVGDNGLVLRTSDGGKNWGRIETYTTKNLYSVYFINSQLGWIVGDSGTILNSSDGGNSWNPQSISGISPLQKVIFKDENTGWCLGSNSLYITNNGGINWASCNSLSSKTAHDFELTNQNDLIIVGAITNDPHYNGFLLKTDVNGQTISQVNLENCNQLFSIDVKDELRVGVGLWGSLTISKDNGSNWNSSLNYLVASLVSISSLDKNNILIAGNEAYSTATAHVLLSHDGGKNWLNKSFESVGTFTGCSYTSNKLIAVTSLGYFITSINNGVDWAISRITSSAKFYDVFFLGNNKGWIVGDYLYSTTDGGNSWIIHGWSIGTKNISFLDDNIGYTYYNKLYITRDGGNSWSQSNQMTFSQYSQIFFLNANLGWLISDGNVFRITDYGASIQQISTINNFSVSSIYFVNQNIGYVIGYSTSNYSSSVYLTTDGGITWNNQASPTGERLNKIIFFDSQNGLIIGEGGAILSTTNGGLSSINQKDTYTLPEEFSLYQNYPNPFNPTTRINYAVPKQSFVSIVIYDGLGRKVTTLVNEEKSAGNYTATYKANNLPSGIYIYQMRTDGFTLTKKMILLK
jgi:photosystem II stability/assembly factor-like uncharacterized protein